MSKSVEGGGGGGGGGVEGLGGGLGGGGRGRPIGWPTHLKKWEGNCPPDPPCSYTYDVVK